VSAKHEDGELAEQHPAQKDGLTMLLLNTEGIAYTVAATPRLAVQQGYRYTGHHLPDDSPRSPEHGRISAAAVAVMRSVHGRKRHIIRSMSQEGWGDAGRGSTILLVLTVLINPHGAREAVRLAKICLI
jgi:hypothetical protein